MVFNQTPVKLLILFLLMIVGLGSCGLASANHGVDFQFAARKNNELKFPCVGLWVESPKRGGISTRLLFKRP